MQGQYGLAAETRGSATTLQPEVSTKVHTEGCRPSGQQQWLVTD